MPIFLDGGGSWSSNFDDLIYKGIIAPWPASEGVISQPGKGNKERKVHKGCNICLFGPDSQFWVITGVSSGMQGLAVGKGTAFLMRGLRTLQGLLWGILMGLEAKVGVLSKYRGAREHPEDKVWGEGTHMSR